MIRVITIVLNVNPSDGDSFALDMGSVSNFYDFSENVYVSAQPWTFKTTPVGYWDVAIGATIAETAHYLWGKMEDSILLNPPEPDFITIEETATGVILRINADDATSSTRSLDGDITITHEGETSAYSATFILSRSPFFVDITSTENVDRAQMSLKIWRGGLETDYPLLPVFNLSKSVVTAGQSTLSFDIHKLINDYVKSNYLGMGDAGPYTSSLQDTAWIEADITVYFGAATIANASRTYLACDGFGYHQELKNPQITQNVLNAVTRHTIYTGQNYPLYFNTYGLNLITINGGAVPFTFDQETSNQKIAYINMKAYTGGPATFSASFQYGEAGTVTHTFEVKTECLHEIVNCIFKNKWGFWQAIPFVKRSKDRLDITAGEYQGNIAAFGAYAMSSHTKKTFNVRAAQKVTVNTDFIDQQYNEAIKQLYLSELVYLERAGVAVPVNRVTESLSYKTVLVDKLIQYTMEFEYSFNLINEIT